MHFSALSWPRLGLVFMAQAKPKRWCYSRGSKLKAPLCVYHFPVPRTPSTVTVTRPPPINESWASFGGWTHPTPRESLNYEAAHEVKRHKASSWVAPSRGHIRLTWVASSVPVCLLVAHTHSFFQWAWPYSAVNFPLLNKLFMAFMPKIFGQKESKGVGSRLGEAERNPRMKDDDGPTSEYASVRVSWAISA